MAVSDNAEVAGAAVSLTFVAKVAGWEPQAATSKADMIMAGSASFK
ncbi:MAG: hypothetical protein ACLPN6_06590 [Streptosporangiaceae bacterium]